MAETGSPQYILIILDFSFIEIHKLLSFIERDRLKCIKQ